jgi:hypothetical protein
MDLSKLLIAKNSDNLKSPRLKEGLLLIASGEIKEGEEILLEVAKEGDSNAYIILGYLMETQGNFTLMELYYHRAQKMGNSAGLYHLGRYFYERGDLSEAREFLVEALGEGVNQSHEYLKIMDEKKDKEYFLFLAFGPLFLLHKKEYEASFWCLLLLGVISLVSYKTLSPLSFILSFIVINFFFSESFDRSNS